MIVEITQCPLLAQSRHRLLHCTCPLSEAKRTFLFALHMSAFGGKADNHRVTEIGMVASIGGGDDYVAAIVGGRCRHLVNITIHALVMTQWCMSHKPRGCIENRIRPCF